MDKYSEVIITSTKKYVDDLEYIAKDNKKLLKDLYQLFILNNMVDWSCTYDIDESCKSKLVKWMNDIINKNPELPNLPYTDKYYSNVNTPQDIYTWASLSHDMTAVNYLTIMYELVEGSTSSNVGTIIAYNTSFTTSLSKGEIIPAKDEVIITMGNQNITCDSYDENTGDVNIENVTDNLKIIIL